MNIMKQAHFFSLLSQGSVYTITNLHLANNTNKLLVASLKRHVYCFEYLENPCGVLVPTTKEVSFTYIPSGADIISIDAFNKSEDKNDFIIGITIIKNSVDNFKLETYLNIYSEWEESKEFNIESIAQNCLNVELKFTPYQLNHTYLITWANDAIINKEVVFLLSGSDNQIHIYRENDAHSYKEINDNDLFPEFYKPPSVVSWIDVHYFNNFTERVTAFGCECGYLRLVKVCTKTNNILFNISTQFVSSISQVKIFKDKTILPKPSFLGDICKAQDGNTVLNLMVVNAVLPAVYFKDITRYGLKKHATLLRKEMISIYTCVSVADIDFDGFKEILLGNSAEEILLYKMENNQLKLKETKKLVSPIYSLRYLDVTGDGVKELIVFTMKGVYIMQHEPEHIQKIIKSKVDKLSIPNVDELKIEDLK